MFSVITRGERGGEHVTTVSFVCKIYKFGYPLTLTYKNFLPKLNQIKMK